MNDNTEDLDLSNVYNTIKKSLERMIVLLFGALAFVLKKWKIIAGLLLLGVALGYFTTSDSKPNQEAEVLVRINFDAAHYVYNQIELLNKKIEAKDSIFFSEIGYYSNSLQVSSLEIKPVINLKDIISNYGSNGRYLEGILKNVEFDKEAVEIWQTFNAEYNYHFINFTLSPDASDGTIDFIFEYINNNELLKDLRVVAVKNIEETIASNYRTISQIDEVLDSYKNGAAASSTSNQIYIVDKNVNLDEVIQQKINMQNRNVNLKEELVLSNNILVTIGKPKLVQAKKSILSNKVIVYPIVFVLIFLFFAGARNMFFSLKKLAEA